MVEKEKLKLRIRQNHKTGIFTIIREHQTLINLIFIHVSPTRYDTWRIKLHINFSRVVVGQNFFTTHFTTFQVLVMMKYLTMANNCKSTSDTVFSFSTIPSNFIIKKPSLLHLASVVLLQFEKFNHKAGKA